MRFRILSIGKPRLDYARLGVDEYLGRLRQFGKWESEQLKAASQSAESAALLERSEGCLRVILDERGELVTSRALAAKLAAFPLTGKKTVAFLIGGADGHTDALKQAADWRWSLSPLTLMHELALVVVLEQLYRACAINAGLPYHRD